MTKQKTAPELKPRLPPMSASLPNSGTNSSRLPTNWKRTRYWRPVHTEPCRESRSRTRNRRTLTVGTAVPLWRFWNGGSTQAVRWTSRPIPTLSGTRNSGTIPLRNKPSSPTHMRPSSRNPCLRRYSRYASSGTARPAQAAAASFPGRCTVPHFIPTEKALETAVKMHVAVVKQYLKEGSVKSWSFFWKKIQFRIFAEEIMRLCEKNIFIVLLSSYKMWIYRNTLFWRKT